MLALFALRSGQKAFDTALDTASVGAALFTVTSGATGFLTFLNAFAGIQYSLDDQFGELDLAGRRGAVGGTGRHLTVEGLHHGGVGVAEDERPPGADEVDVLAPLGVEGVRALDRGDEHRVSAHGTVGADGRRDAAGDCLLGAVEDAHACSLASSIAE